MQNQVTEEDRLRCFVDSKYSPQRTIRHLELKRTQKHMLYSRCMDLTGCLISRIYIEIFKALLLLTLWHSFSFSSMSFCTSIVSISNVRLTNSCHNISV